MKMNYQDDDPLHGFGKATLKSKSKNQSSKRTSWLNPVPIVLVPKLEARIAKDYHYDGTKLIRNHLPLNRRPSRRALKRAATVSPK